MQIICSFCFLLFIFFSRYCFIIIAFLISFMDFLTKTVYIVAYLDFASSQGELTTAQVKLVVDKNFAQSQCILKQILERIYNAKMDLIPKIQ